MAKLTFKNITDNKQKDSKRLFYVFCKKSQYKY